MCARYLVLLLAAAVAQLGPRLASADVQQQSSAANGMEADLNHDDYGLNTQADELKHSGGMSYNSETGRYDDIMEDYFWLDEAEGGCQIGPDGDVILDGVFHKMCDVQLTGINKQVILLQGGLDGIYQVHTCENGRPAFKRQKSPPGEDRILWYSLKFKDWDVSNGTRPDEKDILLYGRDPGSDLRPEFVAKDKWFVASDYIAGYDSQTPYAPAAVAVQCTNKQRAKPTPDKPLQQQPLLTDEEWEDQYRFTVMPAAKAAQTEASQSLNRVLLCALSFRKCAAAINVAAAFSS